LTYGPGGVIAALVVFGVLVPRSFYDREVKRGDTATAAADKNAEALGLQTVALKTIAEENSGLKDEVKALREDIRALRLNGGRA